MSRRAAAQSRVDLRFIEQVSGWPPRLAGRGRSLAARLRLSSFGAFAQLEPMVDLPAFLGGRCETALRDAHLSACFWGLTRDRLADGQSDEVPEEVIDQLRFDWAQALGRALENRRRAMRLVERADRALAAGLSLEASQRRAAQLSLVEWQAAVTARTSWFWLTTSAALPVARRRAFEDGCRLLLLSLQALDDAVDETEDRARYGASIGDRLGVEHNALRMLSSRFASQAALRLSAAGFRRFSKWCEDRSLEVERSLAAGERLLGVLGLSLLDAAVDENVRLERMKLERTVRSPATRR